MESTHLEGRAAVVGAAASGSWPVGPYMLADFVDDLPLQTPEIVDVDITCLEAQGIFPTSILTPGESKTEVVEAISLT